MGSRAIAAAGAGDDAIPDVQGVPADEVDARPFLEQERIRDEIPPGACAARR